MKFAEQRCFNGINQYFVSVLRLVLRSLPLTALIENRVKALTAFYIY